MKMLEGARRPVTPRRLDRPSVRRHSAPVGNGRDWKRLADYVVSARVAAGYPTREAFAHALHGKVTGRTLGNLERGTSVSMQTLAHVEAILGWPPGECRRVLEGGVPTVPQSASPQTSSVVVDGLDELDPIQREAVLISPEEIARRVTNLIQDGQESYAEQWLSTVLGLRERHRRVEPAHETDSDTDRSA